MRPKARIGHASAWFALTSCRLQMCLSTFVCRSVQRNNRRQLRRARRQASYTWENIRGFLMMISGMPWRRSPAASLCCLAQQQAVSCCWEMLHDAPVISRFFLPPPGRSWPPQRLQLPLAPHCSPWLLLVRPGSSSWPLLVPPHSSCFLLESYCVLLAPPLGPSCSLLVPPGSSCNPTFVPLAPPDSVLVSRLVPRCAQRCNQFFHVGDY